MFRGVYSTRENKEGIKVVFDENKYFILKTSEASQGYYKSS